MLYKLLIICALVLISCATQEEVNIFEPPPGDNELPEQTEVSQLEIEVAFDTCLEPGKFCVNVNFSTNDDVQAIHAMTGYYPDSANFLFYNLVRGKKYNITWNDEHRSVGSIDFYVLYKNKWTCINKVFIDGQRATKSATNYASVVFSNKSGRTFPYKNINYTSEHVIVGDNVYQTVGVLRRFDADGRMAWKTVIYYDQIVKIKQVWIEERENGDKYVHVLGTTKSLNSMDTHELFYRVYRDYGDFAELAFGKILTGIDCHFIIDIVPLGEPYAGNIYFFMKVAKYGEKGRAVYYYDLLIRPVKLDIN